MGARRVVADRVVEMLEQRDRRPVAGLATAAEVAERLHVRKSWLYANQHRLGVIRLGDGPNAAERGVSSGSGASIRLMTKQEGVQHSTGSVAQFLSFGAGDGADFGAVKPALARLGTARYAIAAK